MEIGAAQPGQADIQSHMVYLTPLKSIQFCPQSICWTVAAKHMMYPMRNARNSSHAIQLDENNVLKMPTDR
jgi:hypothetical protein